MTERMSVTHLTSADVEEWMPVEGEIYVADRIDEASAQGAKMTVGFARVGAGESSRSRSPMTRSSS